MNKKILAYAVILLLGTTKSVIAHSEIQSLKPHLAHTKISIKQSAACHQPGKNVLLLQLLKQHPYKIVAGLIGATSLSCAAYFAYYKYQERQKITALSNQLETLLDKIINQSQNLLSQQDQKIQDLNTPSNKYYDAEKNDLYYVLSQYNPKILYKALSAQDENGNTIIHRHNEKLWQIIKDQDGIDSLVHQHFDKIIAPLLMVKISTKLRSQLIRIKNNKNKSLFKSIHDNMTKRRSWGTGSTCDYLKLKITHNDLLDLIKHN